MADTYTFVFGLEELILLMRIADVPALPSLPGDPFEGVSEERALAALSAAERSLRARGFITYQGPGKSAIIYSPVLALIGTCKLARAISMVAAQKLAQSPELRYYYVSPYMAVEHAFPEEGLHRFTGAPSIRDLADHLRQALCLTDQQMMSGVPEGDLSQAALEAARNTASAGEAHRLLLNEHLPNALATPLAKALVQPVCTGTVSTAYVDNQRAPATIGLVVDETTVWLLEQGAADGPFHIASVSSDAVLARLITMMAPSSEQRS